MQAEAVLRTLSKRLDIQKFVSQNYSQMTEKLEGLTTVLHYVNFST